MAHEGDPVVSGDGVGERLVFTLLCPVEFLVHVYVFCSRIGITFNAKDVCGQEVGREAEYLHCLNVSPYREDPLEMEMATHSNILAWRILWTERVRHD